MVLKAAVIGCGRMGAEPSSRLEGIVPSGWLPISHIESLVLSSLFSVESIVEIDEKRRQYISSEYSIDNSFSDYNDIFKDENIDIVSIATRTPMKYDILKKAMRSNVKGVYVEKPLANSLAKTQELLDIAFQENCLISYGVNRRFHFTYRKAKSILEQGQIGRLKEVIIEFGSSPLLWSHPHSMDMLIYFAGKPLTVRAEMDTSSFQYNQDENLIDSDPIIESAQFIFEDAVRGSITSGEGCVVRLLGTEGSLTIHGDGAYIQISTKESSSSPYFNKQEFIYPTPPKGATVTAFEELAKAVSGELSKEDFEFSISPDDIMYCQQLLFAAAWSHLNKNRYVTLSEIPLDLTITGRVGEYIA